MASKDKNGTNLQQSALDGGVLALHGVVVAWHAADEVFIGLSTGKLALSPRRVERFDELGLFVGDPPMVKHLLEGDGDHLGVEDRRVEHTEVAKDLLQIVLLAKKALVLRAPIVHVREALHSDRGAVEDLVESVGLCAGAVSHEDALRVHEASRDGIVVLFVVGCFITT